LFDDVRINFRRRRKIEQTVAAKIFFGFELGQAFCEVRVSLRIGIVAGMVMQIRGEGVPLGRIDWTNFGNRLCGFSDGSAKTVVAHCGAGEADNSVALAQRVMYGQVVHRRDDFAFSEIAGGAK